jgi:hypothetical protein
MKHRKDLKVKMNLLLAVIVILLPISTIIFNFIKKRWRIIMLDIPRSQLVNPIFEFFFTIYAVTFMGTEGIKKIIYLFICVKSFFSLYILWEMFFPARFALLQKYTPQFPKMAKVWLDVIFVNRPELLQKILSSPKCHKKPRWLYDLMPFSTGITASGDHRKFFSYSLSSKMLQSHNSTIVEMNKLLCHNLEAHVGAGAFDLLPYAKRFMFDFNCREFFGRNSINDNYCDKVLEAFEL